MLGEITKMWMSTDADYTIRVTIGSLVSHGKP